ncbi:MAG: GTPase-associated system all-helical protein GASH [Solirubrobacteraceae bacterium]
MAAKTYLDQHLAGWLEPYTTDLTEHTLAVRTAAAVDITRQISGNTVLRAVQCAHAPELSADDRQWLGEVVQDHDDTFVNAGKDGLLGMLAAAAVASVLSERPGRRRALIAYAVKSAAFCGMTPKLLELPGLADRALHETAIAVRRRTPISGSAKAVLKAEQEKAAAASAEEEVADESQVGLAALAAHIDTVVVTINARQAMVDEELDLLWWSAQGSNARGERWSSMPPAVKALEAARELQQKSASYVLPPASSALLDAALGRSANTEMTIADFVKAAPDVVGDAPRSSLLPLLACGSVIDELGNSDDSWKTVILRSPGVDVTSSHSLGDIAMQAAREFVMQAHLTA